ncbi:MAG: GNAT family N-acetyltransferase [Anaerolineales bacterium]|nr:GNAT family N-acetyltransferase [Anaerolineales bacterium]
MIISNEKNLEFRPAGEEALKELFAVYKECEDFLALGPVPTASREMVRADLAMSKTMGGRFCGIFLRDGRIVGVLDFVPGNYRGQPDTAYIALLMLKQSFRHQGIGSGALVLVEQEVRKDPRIARIRIGVQVNNPSAIQFWQNRGFRIYAGPELLADQTTVYRMEKLLSPAAAAGS